MTHGNEPPASRRGFVVFGAAALVAIAAAPGPLRAAGWQPDGVHPSQATIAAVFARMAELRPTPVPGFGRRRERWTYGNGGHRYPVDVAVDGDDYRAAVEIDGATYAAGRYRDVPWRANANGVAHDTLGDLQGDAVDRLPRALFPFAERDCSVAGEADAPAPSWVIVDRPPHDKPHWFWVDEQTGLIEREQTREGAFMTTIAFAGFLPGPGGLRPTGWTVTGGDRRNDLDVAVDSVTPGAVSAADLAPPTPHPVFAAQQPPGEDEVLQAGFPHGQIEVTANVGGSRVALVLDTGTQSIMLNRDLVDAAGQATVLDHAVVPSLTVGGLQATNLSVMSIPLFVQGILGYDFFIGRVVHIDFIHHRLEVMSRGAAAAVFDDPHVAVLPADYSEGLPFVTATVDGVSGDRFALDTGSWQLLFFAPFAARAASDRWAAANFIGIGRVWTADFLEGPITVRARTVPLLTMGPLRFTDIVAGVQEGAASPRELEFPFDGIVGLDEMQFFDVWFDVDGKRVGFRG
jgi:hypothetical protein